MARTKKDEMVFDATESSVDNVVDMNLPTQEVEAKIKVSDFVEEYKKATTPAGKTKLVKGLFYRHYVPVLEKYTALAVVFSHSNRDANGVLIYNSFINYISSVLTVIALYTNLAVNTKEESIGEIYDLLKESGALDEIINEIGKNELDEIQGINGMIKVDAQENETNPYKYFAKQISLMINGVKDILAKEEVAKAFRDASSAFQAMTKPQE